MRRSVSTSSRRRIRDTVLSSVTETDGVFSVPGCTIQYNDIWNVPRQKSLADQGVEDSDTSSSTSLDEDAINYAEPEYWNERYEHDVDPFDWLFQFSHFVDAGYMKHIPMEATVLMLGCGNADFSAEMYDHGVKNITNIDLSTVVVEQMRKRNIHRLGMSYHVMDVQELAFPNALFDVVVDKSTMDCIFCCDGSVRIVGRMLTEAYRVLKPGGMYISMSLHTPEKVLPYLSQHPLVHWKVEWGRIANPRYTPESGRSEFHHIFVCKKPLTPDAQTTSTSGGTSEQRSASGGGPAPVAEISNPAVSLEVTSVAASGTPEAADPADKSSTASAVKSPTSPAGSLVPDID